MERDFRQRQKTLKSPIKKREKGKDTGEEEARGWKEKLKKKFRIQKKKLTETIKAQNTKMSERLSEKISEKINEKIDKGNNKIIGMLKKKMEELKREAKLRTE